MLVTTRPARPLRGADIHDGVLHDESVAFAVDRKVPESDSAPMVATFDF